MALTISWGAVEVAAAVFAVGYLFGSIPFGLIFTSRAGLGDIRDIGSGNIGATNVLRTGHRGLAAATLIADGLKGTVAVFVGAAIAPQAAVLAALGAFIGHIFPVWLGFRGGKGVATYVGALAPLSPAAAIVFGLAWAGGAYLSHASSIGALAASLVTPPVLLLLGQRDLAVVYAAMTVILWLRHSDNIVRILAGSEGRIGQR